MKTTHTPFKILIFTIFLFGSNIRSQENASYNALSLINTIKDKASDVYNLSENMSKAENLQAVKAQAGDLMVRSKKLNEAIIVAENFLAELEKKNTKPDYSDKITEPIHDASESAEEAYKYAQTISTDNDLDDIYTYTKRIKFVIKKIMKNAEELSQNLPSYTN